MYRSTPKRVTQLCYTGRMKTHCGRAGSGPHERTIENGYVTKQGKWHCRVCQRERVAAWRATKMTPEQHEAFKRDMRESAKARHARRREAALDHYGRECACCGETEVVFLTMDHIDNNGNTHRMELGGSKRGSGPIYRWLEKEGYPDGFQTLCFNCNTGRHINGGICPHQGGDVQRFSGSTEPA